MMPMRSLDYIAANDAEAVIPSKSNRLVQRETDWHTYKGRHLVECFFNKIKHYPSGYFQDMKKYARPLLINVELCLDSNMAQIEMSLEPKLMDAAARRLGFSADYVRQSSEVYDYGQRAKIRSSARRC